MRFAVFANPKAAYFADPNGLQSLYKVTSGRGILTAPETQEELERELTELIDEAPQFVGIAGGDGSLSQFTTSLLKVWPHDRLPKIAVIQAGTMNTISRSLGIKGDPVPQTEAYAKIDGNLKTVSCRPLKVGDHRYGYLFGTGIIPRFIEAYEEGGDTSPKKAAQTLASLVLDAFKGGERAKAFFAPTPADVWVDDQPWPMKSWLLVAAGATPDLGLKFRPFPGLSSHPDKVGVFASASRPARFALDLIPFRFQRPARHSLAFHALADTLRVRSDAPIVYNLDGDIETVEGEVTITRGPELTFLVP